MDLKLARQAILDGLAPVAVTSLAGRVYPYPPLVGRQSGPAIWIEQPDVSLSTTGNNTSVVVASFDVWIVVDGATDAQLGALDDAVSQVWAAMRQASVPGALLVRPVGVTPDTVDVRDGDRTHSRRASVVTVDVVVAANSFCPPTPIPVEIPPTLVSASVEE